MEPWRKLQEACARGYLQRVGALVRLHTILDRYAKTLGATKADGSLDLFKLEKLAGIRTSDDQDKLDQFRRRRTAAVHKASVPDFWIAFGDVRYVFDLLVAASAIDPKATPFDGHVQWTTIEEVVDRDGFPMVPSPSLFQKLRNGSAAPDEYEASGSLIAVFGLVEGVLSTEIPESATDGRFIEIFATYVRQETLELRWPGDGNETSQRMAEGFRVRKALSHGGHWGTFDRKRLPSIVDAYIDCLTTVANARATRAQRAADERAQAEVNVAKLRFAADVAKAQADAEAERARAAGKDADQKRLESKRTQQARVDALTAFRDLRSAHWSHVEEWQKRIELEPRGVVFGALFDLRKYGRHYATSVAAFFVFGFVTGFFDKAPSDPGLISKLTAVWNHSIVNFLLVNVALGMIVAVTLFWFRGVTRAKELEQKISDAQQRALDFEERLIRLRNAARASGADEAEIARVENEVPEADRLALFRGEAAGHAIFAGRFGSFLAFTIAIMTSFAVLFVTVDQLRIRYKPRHVPVGEPRSPSSNDAVVRVERVVRVKPTSVVASSYLKRPNEQYPPGLAFDGDAATAWNTPGRGKGEWIEAHFSEPILLHHIVFRNGWDSVSQFGDTFVRNAKFKTAKFLFDKGMTRTLSLAVDQRVATLDDLNVTTSTIRILAQEVWPGTAHMDLCLGEVEIYATIIEGAEPEPMPQIATSGDGVGVKSSSSVIASPSSSAAKVTPTLVDAGAADSTSGSLPKETLEMCESLGIPCD